ncbi:MAG: prolipoprotein diacylglyceryl transferase [Kiritimatiellae bacterium]|nr:prolipoprotein diacylglyceryl transferase [Kiritimatiellia bacterium]
MTNQVTHWVHQIDPVLIPISGTFGVRYYGLAYLLAFAVAYALLSLMRRRGLVRLTGEQQQSLMSYLLLGVLLGGRLGYVILYAWSDFLDRPWMVFEVWHGGMASHGGFVGVILAIWLFSRKQHVPVLELGDALAVMTPPGLLLGRIANFINGELWGIPSQVKWAVIFPASAPGVPLDRIPARHPSQLYEAGLEGLLPMVYVLWRMFGTRAPQYPGRIGGEFLVLYAVMRLIGECFREPDATLIMGLSRGMFYSLFMIIFGIGLMVHSRRATRGRAAA